MFSRRDSREISIPFSRYFLFDLCGYDISKSLNGTVFQPTFPCCFQFSPDLRADSFPLLPSSIIFMPVKNSVSFEGITKVFSPFLSQI